MGALAVNAKVGTPDEAIMGLACPQRGRKVFVCIYQVHYKLRG